MDFLLSSSPVGNFFTMKINLLPITLLSFGGGTRVQVLFLTKASYLSYMEGFQKGLPKASFGEKGSI